MTPTRWPCARQRSMSWSQTVLLPLPGGPVTPTTWAAPGAASDRADDLLGGRVPVLDQPDRPCQGAHVALEEAGGDVHARRV